MNLKLKSDILLLDLKKNLEDKCKLNIYNYEYIIGRPNYPGNSIHPSLLLLQFKIRLIKPSMNFIMNLIIWNIG